MNNITNYTYPFNKMTKAVTIRADEKIFVTLADGEEMWYKFNTDYADAHPFGNVGEYLFSTDYKALHEIDIISNDGTVIYSIDTSCDRPERLCLEAERIYYIRVHFPHSYPAALFFSIGYINQRELLQNGFNNAEEIPCRCPITRELAAKDGDAFFRFVADKALHTDGAPEEYTFKLSSLGGTELVLYRADGTELARSTATVTAELDQGEQYYIRVINPGSSTVLYVLSADYNTLSAGEAAENAIPIGNTANISSEHICQNRAVWYSFTTDSEDVHPDGTPGEYLFSFNGDAEYSAYIYDGTAKTYELSVDGSANRIELNYNKTYHICIKAKATSLGSYSFTLDSINKREFIQNGMQNSQYIDIWMPGADAGDYLPAYSSKWYSVCGVGEGTPFSDEPSHQYDFKFGGDGAYEVVFYSSIGRELDRFTYQGDQKEATHSIELFDNYFYLVCLKSLAKPVSTYMRVDYKSPVIQTGESKELAYIMTLNKVREFGNENDGELWVKFTPDSPALHPDGGAAKYRIAAATDFFLTAELSDAQGNTVSFTESDPYTDPGTVERSYMLNYKETYYLHLSAPGCSFFTVQVDTLDVTIPSGDSMAEALPLYEDWSEGRFSSASAAKWYSFTASKTSMTVEAMSDTEIYGEIYESDGAFLGVDDNTYAQCIIGPRTFFTISRNDFKQGERYFVKIAPLSSASQRAAAGPSFKLRLSTSVPAQSVETLSKEVDLALGESLTLNASVYPENASYSALTWHTNDTDVISLDPKTGRVTAKAVGTAYITVKTQSGKYDYCRVYVSAKEKVIIYRIDDVGNDANGEIRVKFTKSGKIWRVVNHDMIYYIDDYKLDPMNPGDVDPSRLPPGTMDHKRCDYNLYVNPETPEAGTDDANLRTYTYEEIRLLYAIDPYGVAAYVASYSEEATTLGKNTLQIKDEFYTEIFGKEPMRFVRVSEGSWRTANDSDPENAIYSESEAFFGSNMIWDEFTKEALKKFGDMILDIFVGRLDKLLHIKFRECLEDIETENKSNDKRLLLTEVGVFSVIKSIFKKEADALIDFIFKKFLEAFEFTWLGKLIKFVKNAITVAELYYNLELGFSCLDSFVEFFYSFDEFEVFIKGSDGTLVSFDKMHQVKDA